MSDLEDLAAAVRALGRQGNSAQQLVSAMISEVDQLGNSLAGLGHLRHLGGLSEALDALSAARRKTAQAARQLQTLQSGADAFADSLVGGGGQGVAAALGGAALASSMIPGAKPSRSESSALAAHWAAHPDDYRPPSSSDWAPVPRTLAPHSDPASFAPWVNDGGTGVDGRSQNCADCARSVELSWRGQPQVSAARKKGGESFDDVEAWLRAPLKPSTFTDIGTTLASAGHGASAYVAVSWKPRGGHAFNAVNYKGTVYFIDAQPTGGAVGEWPPRKTSPGYGFDESNVSATYVTYFP